MISVPPLQTRCPKCLDWVEVPVIADQTLNGTTLHITLKPDMTWAHVCVPSEESPAEIETTWRELVTERNDLKAERAMMKTELTAAWKALRSYDYDGTVFGWLGHQIDAQLSALTSERDALKAEIGAAWEAAPDGYEADSLESLVQSLAFLAEGESEHLDYALAFVADDEHETQRADPPRPYIDGAPAWLASIEPGYIAGQRAAVRQVLRLDRGPTMSEPLQYHGHSIAVSIEPGYIAGKFKCTEPKGALCRTVCQGGCEEWSTDDDVTCSRCGTKLVSADCQAMLFLADEGMPSESYAGPEAPLYSGPIEAEWDGYRYTWTYSETP